MDREQLEAAIWRAMTKRRGFPFDQTFVDELLDAADQFATTEARIRSQRLGILDQATCTTRPRQHAKTA